MAGMTMWLGVSCASWMIHSPRSVSTTRSPAVLQVVVEKDLLGDHALALGQQSHVAFFEEVENEVTGFVSGGSFMDCRAGAEARSMN